MFLELCSHRGLKKSIFFKTKHCIANPYNKKLDLVSYFAPLVAFDVEMKIEKEDSFSMGRPNAFLGFG